MVTIKIDERTKAGKVLLHLIELYSESQKGIEIVEPVTKVKQNKKIPNTQTRKTIEETDKGIGLTKTKSHEDLMEKLFS
jgi:antitoxin component of RelBE/YafQ-DinJ toxin-antitoxin module